jgi:hypothetical protein
MQVPNNNAIIPDGVQTISAYHTMYIIQVLLFMFLKNKQTMLTEIPPAYPKLMKGVNMYNLPLF